MKRQGETSHVLKWMPSGWNGKGSHNDTEVIGAVQKNTWRYLEIIKFKEFSLSPQNQRSTTVSCLSISNTSKWLIHIQCKWTPIGTCKQSGIIPAGPEMNTFLRCRLQQRAENIIEIDQYFQFQAFTPQACHVTEDRTQSKNLNVVINRNTEHGTHLTDFDSCNTMKYALR